MASCGGAYMYLFTRKVLDWRETDYGLWVTYKNLIAALGSDNTCPRPRSAGVREEHCDMPLLKQCVVAPLPYASTRSSYS
ncbi:hypothetical protein O3P69_002072 [Scylla paramamosain]|uniref:Uncharacterized protein n=1 Tax=Scylla paramamosain TaxID=85552 RepID=A0AAW0V5Y3_SCYPA